MHQNENVIIIFVKVNDISCPIICAFKNCNTKISRVIKNLLHVFFEKHTSIFNNYLHRGGYFPESLNYLLSCKQAFKFSKLCKGLTQNQISEYVNKELCDYQLGFGRAIRLNTLFHYLWTHQKPLILQTNDSLLITKLSK